MVTETNTQSNYRYPGIRPFYDNDIDRRLFFGRDTEKEALLHKVLVENLVVLYARSGLGKTSLLNAGLNQALRDRGFIPLMVRLNNPGLDPIQGIYAGIEEIAKQVSIEVEPGEDATLWQYFKTTYFWSASNKMLTPVLILDQFEEFFTLYSPGDRKGFIRQLADVVNNKIPASLLESMKPKGPFSYNDNSPNVKIIISIREDYVGQLDEMSREIPDILHHRFRLLPLSREQAGQAIIKPSKVQDEVIGAASFTFAAKAVDAMLDFLCKRRERGIIKMTDEVESFQLQLLCRHIENKVREKTKKKPGEIMVKKKELGGKVGMQLVLQRFYDDQVEQLGPEAEKGKVRKLCEEGLISITDRRLSLEEEEITRQFKVSKVLLQELVNRRLLRAESRVGSVYYELSHDTLVVPIRESQKKRELQKLELEWKQELERKRKSRKKEFGFGICLLCIILIVAGFFIGKKILYRIDSMNQTMSGNAYYGLNDYHKAIAAYKKAIEIDQRNVSAYINMGNAYYMLKEYEETINACQKAIEIDKKIVINPEYAPVYINMGNALLGLKRYEEAENVYKKAIKIDPQNVVIYINMAAALYGQKRYNEAIDFLKEAIKIDPKSVAIYINIGAVLTKQKKYNEAIDFLKKAIKIDPKNVVIYINLGAALNKQKKYNEAIDFLKKAIKINKTNPYSHGHMGNALLGMKKPQRAIAAYKETIEIDPANTSTKTNLAMAYLIAGHFNDAFAQANNLLKEKDILIDDILAIRFVSICALVFQEKQLEAAEQLKNFTKYYESISGEYERDWRYSEIKDFIIKNKKLPQKQRELLLQLVDLLESPKKQGDKKLQELETSIQEVFK